MFEGLSTENNIFRQQLSANNEGFSDQKSKLRPPNRLKLKMTISESEKLRIDDAIWWFTGSRVETTFFKRILVLKLLISNFQN